MFCASVLSLSFSRGERMATTNCQARDNQEVQVSSIYREHPVTASNKQRYSLYQDMLPQRLAPTPNSPINRNGQQSSAHHYRRIGELPSDATDNLSQTIFYPKLMCNVRCMLPVQTKRWLAVSAELILILGFALLFKVYVDSAVSKTRNVGEGVSYDEFKNLYFDAWKAGCKGITTFRAAGKRYGILNEVKTEEKPVVEACYIDPNTGQKSCE